MANLIFKKGSSVNFTSLTNNKGLSEGSFYWTEDDNRLFLGISSDAYIEITHTAIKNEFLQLLNNLATEIDSCVCDIEKSSTGHGIVVSFKNLDAKTIELDIPADAYRVTVTARDASKKAYLTGATNANNDPQALVRDSDIYMDTTAGSLHAVTMNATTFKGDLEGTASKALVAENATADHMGNIIADTYLSEASLTDHNLVMISPVENGESAKSFTLVIPDERVKTETNNSIRIYLTGATDTDEAIGTQYLNSAIYADKDGASAKLVAPKFDGVATQASADDLGNTISATYYNQAEINGWQLKLGTPSSATAKTLTLPQHSKATSTTLGLVKVGFTETGKKYPVELNTDGQMYVEVPWTDTVLTDHNTTYTFEDVADGWKVTASDGSQTFTHKDKSYSKATSDTLGLVKIGFTESGQNYPVELNTDGQMFVNVPWQNTWIDTNTTYTFEQTANGWKVVDSDGDEAFTYVDKDTTYTHLPNPNLLTIKVNGTTAISYDGSSTGTLNLKAGTNVQISKDSSNNITFSSTDTNTTYTVSGAADSEGYDITLAGSEGSSSSAHINVANDTTLGLVKTGFQQNAKNYPVETNAAGEMFVNVPWTDTIIEDTNTTYTISGSNNAGGYQIELNDDKTGGDSSHVIPKASDTSFGVIKTGFTDDAAAHNYAVKLDATNGKAYVGVPIDASLNSTSTNAVENKAVAEKTAALEQKDTELNTAITNLTEALETTDTKLGTAFDDVSWTQDTGVLAFSTVNSTTNTDSITINPVTTTTQGLMSAEDKKKLDGIASGANKTVVDSTLNGSSTNPVQNKVVYNRINEVEDNSIIDVNINNHTLTFDFGSGSNPKEIVIPDNDTTYTAGPWLKLTGTQFEHGIASGISEGGVTVGQADNISGWNKTFTVPSVTIDEYGHVTAASESTITIPANPNVDTKMKQSASTNNNNYPLLASKNTNPNGSATEGIYNTGVTVNPSTKKITATAFVGSLEGNANTATSATKAQKDNLDNIIDTTYAANLEGSATATTYDLDLQTLHDVSLNKVSVLGATTNLAGLMTAADKVKLDGIATGANKIIVDSSLSTTSTNPVQNKVVATAINNINTSIEDINEDYISDISYNNTTHKLSYTKNGASTDVVAIPKLDSNNKISIDYLPDGAISKLHVVASKDAAKKLTKAQVQNGDTVLVDDADKIMYYIVDDTKLSADGTTAISDANFALAFKEYSAGLAEKADRDILGNSISGTYISSITASGRNITYKTQADVAAGGAGTTISVADARVAQTGSVADGEFPILLRGTTAGMSNTTEGTSFSGSATINPSNGNIKASGKVTASQGFVGNLNGNAATASLADKATLDASNNNIDAAYHSATLTTDTNSKKVVRLSRSNGGYTDITLNGQFTDTTYTAGDCLTLTGTDFDHDKSSVSAGSYGTATTADGWGESVEFPTFTVDEWGHITAASTGTIKIPSNPNTDTKMNMVAHGNTKSYLLGTTTSPTSSAIAVSGVADSNIYISAETADSPAQLVSENGFVGNLTGVATSATSAEKDSAGNTIASSLYDVSLTADSDTQKVLTFVRGEGEDATIILNGKFTDTTYSAGAGLSLSGTTFKHSNSITASSVGPGSASTLTWGGKFIIPTVAYDAQGHITGAQSIEFTMPANPDTNTTYSAGTGLSLSGTTFNHTNSVTAGSIGPGSGATLGWGGTFTVPSVTYDAQGHITGSGLATFTMPANPNTDTKNTAGSTLTTDKIYLVGGKTLPTASTSHSQTFANNQIFAQNGALYSEGKQVATMEYVQTYHAANMPAVTDAMSYSNTSLSGYTLTMTNLSGNTKNYTIKDIYVSKAEWTNGTSLGPVLKLSRTDSTGATVAALTATIPNATGTQSGAVTTATQTFGGQKIFADATDSTSSVSPAAINTAGGISIAKTVSAAQARIGDHVVLKYNATQGCLEFEFA